MESPSSKYFRVPRMIQIVVGLWPFSSRSAKIPLRTISAASVLFMFVPQIRSFKKAYKNGEADEAFYNIAISLYISLTFMKLFTSIVAEDKIRTLYEAMDVNWQIISNDEERAILVKYSEIGELIVLNYLVFLGGGLVVFLLLPLLPTVFDKFSPLDEPRARIYLVTPTNVFQSYGDYYIQIYIYDAFNTIFTIAIITAVDLMYMSCVQHCVGLFAVTAYRLRNVDSANDYDNKHGDTGYEYLIETIKWHKRGLHCADMLENTFSGSFLILTGINLVYFSILSIVLLINLGNPINVIRYGLVAGGCIFQMFFLSWPGQKLTDESLGLFINAYSNSWYELSKESKVLLYILCSRSSKPALLTAGKVYTMNFQNFAAVMKTSISYITVLGSFR